MNEAVLDQKYPGCIAGIGARTPLGLNAPASSAAVRAAIGAIREHPYFVDKVGEPMSVAMDAALSPDLDGVERFAALAIPAMEEALAPLGTPSNIRGRIPALIGLPEARPGRPAHLEDELARRLEKELAVRVTMIPKGHASGLMALEEACNAIQEGRAEFCLAGGVDSYLEPETLEWLDQEKQLLSSQNRSGFPPGEGAGFCLLAAAAPARRLGLDIQAWIIAAATSTEKNRIKTDDICIGEGLSEAISRVSSSLKLPEEKINATYCDLNGERYRSEEFMFTALRTQLAFVNTLDNLTPTDCWGDAGAASGPLFAALAIASGLRGYASGPRSLLWAGSEGGQRSAVLLYLATHPSA
jgi:3-oxoacyl-[acyl-carrier-protein] synthase I